MKKGWICLHRKIQECDLWINNEPFDIRSAWIDLLLLANHEDVDIVFDYKPMTVKRGQFLTSVRKLGARWSWSKNRTLKYLRLLESLGMIERDSDRQRTLLTIVKYDVYQGLWDTDMDTTVDTGKDTHIDTGVDTGMPQTTMKNNENNENKINNKRFAKPSVDEIRNYCLERKNGIDPQQFFDYYESKGWMIGKNHMKDWKASVRTWENRRKGEDNGSVARISRVDEEERNREIDEHFRRVQAGEIPDERPFADMSDM